MNFDLSPAIERVQKMVVGMIANLPNMLLAVFAMVVFLFLAKMVRNLAARTTHKKLHTHSAGLAIGRLTQGFTLLVGLLISLSVALPTFKPTDVIQLLGIGSVAIGFAFRDIFQNFLAGILLLVTQPFRIDDQIVVSGYEGTVEDIQARATLIKTYDGRRVVIPNSDLFTQKVMVNTAFSKRRVKYDVGIGYGDDIDRAKAVILEAVGECEHAMKDPGPEVFVTDLASSAVTLRLRFWVQPADQRHYVEALDQVLVRIKNKLTEAGIDLPYPTQQILFHDQTEDIDGDRAKQREGWPVRTTETPAPREMADRNGH